MVLRRESIAGVLYTENSFQRSYIAKERWNSFRLSQELAAKVMKELKPTLDQEGIRLVAIGIGYPEIGKEFCQHTGWLLHLQAFLPVAHNMSFRVRVFRGSHRKVQAGANIGTCVLMKVLMSGHMCELPTCVLPFSTCTKDC